MHSQQHKCQHKLVKINGRTLKNALETTKANNKFGNFSLTHWVEVCPQCDAYALGIETTHPWPFLCSDGVMRTVEDFNQHSQQFESENMDLCGFIFSKSALNSAIALIQIEDSSTEVVEEMGARVAQNQNDAFSLQFSKAVCDWGRGQRVWANLNRRNAQETLGNALNEWFRIVVNTDNAEEAISYGTEISGLGVSFASKHLRMIAPDKYAVLDEVLSDGLGFALNTKGYGLFLHSLRDFKEKYKVDQKLATIESGIFILIRQLVRAR